MTRFLPHATETLVVALGQEEVTDRLARATTQQFLTQNEVRSNAILFTGHVQENSFRLSLKITRPNNFIPLVHGTVAPTSAGCIVFLTYSLFPTTRMFLSFWILFTILAGIFTAHQYNNLLTGFTAGAIAVAILLIAQANFRIQLKRTREALRRLMS